MRGQQPGLWRLPALLIVSTLLATGCGGWPMLDFGPQRTGYNPTETAINAANVGRLQEAWTTTAGNGAPVVADDKLFVVDSGDSLEDVPGYIRAFDSAGNTNCSTGPRVCAPLWTATFTGSAAAPAVVNGVAYVSTEVGLLAFDAAGKTGCSGSPTTCTPLWTGNATSIYVASPLVWNGTVYAGSTQGTLYAFDAAGVSNCANTPKTCAPVWTASTGGPIYAPPAGANGVLYVGTLEDTNSLYAFDAAGITNCSGTTKTCSPLWRGNRPFGVRSAPAIANGVVYVGDSSITAFDAAGVTNCSGTPTICSPLWDTPALNAGFNGPAVARGVVYGSYFAGHLTRSTRAGPRAAPAHPRRVPHCGRRT
ncbi:MAG: PQQ-binding-like beta-propeller repeat protein [Actinomycetota bacterium]|nr:PQQ-binding-like beta-propeller repeat protein [Actinomycetota bacterium]